MSATAQNGRRRVRARVEGTVQGVGFRPHAFRLATELGFAGWVLNDDRGVLLEVEGDQRCVESFLARLSAEAPPLAAVEHVWPQELEPTGASGFAILASRSAGQASAPVSPDSATCEACLRELLDPADRRHRYPFINCTDCGPRFTIIRAVPYDRPNTTMAGFAMCERCAAEYGDPADRRFHAQPNACPRCGPRRLTDAQGVELDPGDGLDAVGAAARALADGAIVAVKGLGGFHLACRADDEPAVARLRARKHREERPFALMAADLAAARALVVLGEGDAELLCSPARPIVLAPRRPDAPALAASLAPGCADLGVMLPYSPLHHLLLRDFGGPLVMTSGNVSDEPIAYEDADALERLATIAERFLLHDRPIHMRTDDSVVRSAATGPLLIRRSRGHVPAALPLPVHVDRHVLGTGAELKSTFCLAKGGRAWVSQHIGDLANAETLASYGEGVAHFERLFDVSPELVAHDLHPDYLSTRYAQEYPGAELVAVQHHHAHLAACAAEHGVLEPVLGVILDGAGLGPDGTIWGGEILAGDLAGFERAAHLWPVRLPGGDAAAREPWRMACAWLLACEERDDGDGRPPAIPPGLAGVVEPERWAQVARLARGGFRAPVTTSAGRLFDAVAALCGLRAGASYEGQAAALLESSCDPGEQNAYAMALLPGATPADPAVLDARALVRAVDAELHAGVAPARVAARFHNGLADGLAAACARIAHVRGLDTVALSGGVFQNRRLLERTAAELERSDLRVLIPRLLPPNDGGVAYGQVAVAAARARA